MKALWRRLAGSFRLRLTLLLTVAVALLLGAYGYAVSRKLERVSVNRVEDRLRRVAARWAPDALRGIDPLRLQNGGGEEVRGIRLASVWIDGTWNNDVGVWPLALQERLTRWVREEGFELVSLMPPELPGADGDAVVLGRRTVLSEPLKGRELGKFVFHQWQVEGVPWAVLCARLNNRFIALAYNLVEEQATARSLTEVQLIYFVVAVVPILALAWIFATRALRPVHTLAATMREISARNLRAQLPDEDAVAEFRDLIRVFNEMVVRLERSFRQASRFSSDAAHELRTPLTVLQGELEAAMVAEETGSETQQKLSSMLEEVQRLKGITDRLLLLARADAGSLLQRRTAVELRPLVDEVLEDLEATSPELELRHTLDRIAVEGDPVLLRQAVFNLLSNAAKYNRPEGWIAVQLRESSGRGRRWGVLEVENAAEPISAEAQEHLFDRFFRADSARSRIVDGFGLGLSLTREIARAHGGDLELVRSDEAGTAFRLTLPAMAIESLGAGS